MFIVYGILIAVQINYLMAHQKDASLVIQSMIVIKMHTLLSTNDYHERYIQ